MKNVVRLLVGFISIGSTVMVVGQGGPHPFSLAIHARQSVIKSSDPAIIEVQIRNVSDHEIGRTVAPGWTVHGELIGFVPIVRNASGSEPPLTKWGKQVFGRQKPDDHLPDLVLNAVQRVPMAPGEVVKTEIHLTELYDLSAPGTYTVQVKSYDEENKVEVTSSIATITVRSHK